jgi:histidinol phosphatase-like enzyme
MMSVYNIGRDIMTKEKETISKCAWLDFNGVIAYNNCNKPDGAYYLIKPEDWCAIPESADAHKLLCEAGYRIIWVTSQGSIGEGLITKERIVAMFEAFRQMFRAYNDGADMVTEIAIIDPQIIGKDSDPAVRKAKADAKLGVMVGLAKKYHIDMTGSLGVGDRKSDIDSFERAEIGHKYQILTPFGDGFTQKAHRCYPDLITCVKDHIKNHG